MVAQPEPATRMPRCFARRIKALFTISRAACVESASLRVKGTASPTATGTLRDSSFVNVYGIDSILVRVTYSVAVSMDGYIATIDGGLGWLKPFESIGEDYGYHEFYRGIDAAIMGSHTYEQCLSFAEWPYPGKPCWVLSRRSFPNARCDVTVTSETPIAILRKLRALGLMRIWLAGGGALAASMRKSGLIDEYIVSVIPVILGGGIGLFAHGSAQDTLSLVNSKIYPNGVAQLHYRTRARAK